MNKGFGFIVIVAITIVSLIGCTGSGTTPPLIEPFLDSVPDWVIEKAIAEGADVNQKPVTDEYGFTPLHYAAEDNSFSVIEALVKKGADINARDVDGFRPRDYLVSNYELTAEEVKDAYILLGGSEEDAEKAKVIVEFQESIDVDKIEGDRENLEFNSLPGSLDLSKRMGSLRKTDLALTPRQVEEIGIINDPKAPK